MDTSGMKRFKIDIVKDSGGGKVGLFYKRKGLFGYKWVLIDYSYSGHTESLKTIYEKIKDLPEYLD